MNYLEWSNKLWNYYFNDSKKNEEVFLFIDNELLDLLSEKINGEGKDDFLSIFNPDMIFTYTPTRTNFGYNQLTQYRHFNTLENLVRYLDDSYYGYFQIHNKNENIYFNNPKLFFPFIILSIYAYSVESVFTTTDQKNIFGDEMSFRRSVVSLYKKIETKTQKDDWKYGKLIARNLFNRLTGPRRYSGYFEYYSLFRRSDILDIQKRLIEMGRQRDMIFTNLDDVKILFSFLKRNNLSIINDDNKKVALNIINAIINKKITISASSKKATIGINNIIPKISRICIYPYLRKNYNNEWVEYIKASFYGDNKPELLTITTANNTDLVLESQEGRWYKAERFQWSDYHNDFSAHNFDCDFIDPKNNFFLRLGDAFSDLNSSSTDFIYSVNSVLNSPAFYYSTNQNTHATLTKEGWTEIALNRNLNLLFKENSDIRYICSGKDIFISNPLNNSSVFYLQGGFYLNSSSKEESYPDFLIPKVYYVLESNTSLILSFYNSEVKLIETKIYTESSHEIDLQNIISDNLKEISIVNISLKSNDTIFQERTIRIVPELIQQRIESKYYKLTEISFTQEVEGNQKIYELIETDLMTRFINSYFYYSKNDITRRSLGLIKKDLYKCIDYVNSRVNQNQELSYIDKFEVLRNLIALGYLYEKETDIFSTKPCALIQVNKKNYTFLLSGGRNLNFTKEIIKTAISVGAKVIAKSNPTLKSNIANILPPEIYFHFDSLDNITLFINSGYNGDKISDYLSLIPFKRKEIFKLSLIGSEEEILKKNSDRRNWKAGDFSFDFSNGVNNYVLDPVHINDNNYNCVKFKNDNYLWLGKKRNNLREWIYVEKDWVRAFVYSQNNIPYLFSKNHGDKELNSYENIYIKTTIPLPQEYLNFLIYESGGLPIKVKLESKPILDLYYDNNVKGAKQIEIDYIPTLIEGSEYYRFSNISRETRIIIEKNLNTKIIYLRNSTWK